MLNFYVAAKEKFIVFSQYLPSLDILEKILVHKKKFKQGSEVLRLDGKASLEQRETLIDQFNVDPMQRFCLLQSGLLEKAYSSPVPLELSY